MIENSEIVTKLIVASALLYVVIKLMMPIARLFWDQFFNNAQKSNINIDILVERQKQVLRKGMVTKKTNTLQPRSDPNRTLVAYKNHFQKLLSSDPDDQESLADIKKIFSLFDNLQWGEGTPFEDIRKKIQEEFVVSIEQVKITNVLKRFIEDDFLLSRQGSNLPSYKEIIEVIELATIVSEIFYESVSNKYLLLERLSYLWKISCPDITKGVCFLLEAQNNSQTKTKKDILNNKIQINRKHEDKIFQIIKSDDEKFFRSKKDFMKNLNSNAFFFSMLSPLDSPKDNHDLHRARKIFYANKTTSLEEIKKTYKKIASMKHPDKLYSYGIPSEFEPMATKNFSIIQQSYDIILNEYKNNENK